MQLISMVGINSIKSFWIGRKTTNFAFVIYNMSLFNISQDFTDFWKLIISVSFAFVLVMGIEYQIKTNGSVSSANDINSKP